MDEIVTPHEAQIETLLQILACLLDQLGGEVVLSRASFSAYEGVPVVGRYISKDYVMLRIALEDEGEVTIDLPEDRPQP